MIEINNTAWTLRFVPASSRYLRRSDGSWTIGMTDGVEHCIYIAAHLHGALLDRVMAHELCHAFCFSYGIEMELEEEEFLADWVSLYGRKLVYLLDRLMQSIINKSA